MSMEKDRRRPLRSWLSVVALLVLCGILGVLQYRWIGEVSRAEWERLRGSLNASLYRLSQDFNTEITLACATLSSAGSPGEERVPEQEYASGYQQWKSTTRHEQLFRRIILAVPQNGAFTLRSLDLDTGAFHDSEWPDEWSRLRDRMNARLSPDIRRGQPPPPFFGDDNEGLLIPLPHFRRGPGGPPPGRFGREEPEWLIFELNLDYVRSVLLPEVIHRHLGSVGASDYQVEVVTRAEPSTVIYRSDPNRTARIGNKADASVPLFELQFDRLARRVGLGGMREGGRIRAPGWEAGRWQMSVRHRAGSLEALVTRARWRNLAVLAGILILLLATVAALIRYTRRAQRLADLQMDFVAGVSHELRTPLTVICTAAYNLRGKVAGNPSQVERYGALIQQESEKSHGTCRAGPRLRKRQSRAGRPGARTAGCRKPHRGQPGGHQGVFWSSRDAWWKSTSQPDLPSLAGRRRGAQARSPEPAQQRRQVRREWQRRWIGISAATESDGRGSPMIEICVADHGPGIPADEQAQIFEPFFRGRNARAGSDPWNRPGTESGERNRRSARRNN